MEVFKDKMIIDDFTIKNPWGFDQHYAFSAKKIIVSYSLDSLPSKIDEIQIIDSYMSIECKTQLCLDNNWNTLLKRIDKKEKRDPKDGVTIGKIHFNRLFIDSKNLNMIIGQNDQKELNNLNVYNINSKKGFPTMQL